MMIPIRTIKARGVRSRRSVVAAALLLLATACGAAATSGEVAAPTDAATDAATVDGPSETSNGAAASALTALSDTAVVGPAGDETFVNPGGVVHHHGRFHMLRNSFTAFPGPASSTYLTSTDGQTWQEEATEPVLSSADVPYADEDEIVFVMSLLVDDEAWVAYFYTFDGELNPGVIGRATADDPAGPWAVDPEPVLTPGADGDWDERRVAEPSVVVTDDGLAMYYVGFDSERVARIGLATSDDGISWDKHDGPVLEAGAEWDGGAIGSPQVVSADDGLLMVYDNAVRGQYALGFARSSDGVSWSPESDNPQLTADDAPGPQFFQYELVRGPDGLLLLLEAGSGSTRTDVFAYGLDG